MEIIEFFSAEDKAPILEQMTACDWPAGQELLALLQAGTLQAEHGAGTLVLLLMDGDRLAAFCIYAPQDSLLPGELCARAGYIYTFPAYRGRRCAGLLLNRCESIAAVMGKPYLYIATEHTGLYAKYGYAYFRDLPVDGILKRVYRKALQGEGAD